MKIVNREAMEAHLTLSGWIPCMYGSIGARKGNIVWYLYREMGESNGDLKLGHSLLQPNKVEKHDTDMWYWSDELFWPLARHLQSDAVRIKTESVVENYLS